MNKSFTKIFSFILILLCFFAAPNLATAQDEEKYEPEAGKHTLVRGSPLSDLAGQILSAANQYNQLEKRKVCTTQQRQEIKTQIEEADSAYMEAYGARNYGNEENAEETFKTNYEDSQKKINKADNLILNCTLLTPDAETELEGFVGTKGEQSMTDMIKTILTSGTKIFLGLLTFFAILMIVIGGGLYITSAGDDAKATKAKDYIKWAIIGLLVAGFSYAIVRLVLNMAFFQS